MAAMRALALLIVAGCGSGGGTPAPDAGTTLVATFPAGFHWGAATAPYQNEGGLHGTDWYTFESSCGQCSHDRADDGPDSWNRWEADLDLARAGKHNAIRLGIDWSRVFPDGMDAPPDAAAVARYHEILRGARERGLRPLVTLHHFATPTWLAGAWLHADAAARFEDWARFAGAEFGAEVDWWVTINEPIVYVTFGYLLGSWPPGHVADLASALQAVDALLDGHARAYDALHAADTVDADGDGRAAWVSITSHQRVYRGKTTSAEDARAAAILQSLGNRLFFDALVLGRRDTNYDLDFDDPGERDFTRLAGKLDYLGVNYYGVALVEAFAPGTPPPLVGNLLLADLGPHGFVTPVNDLGWAIYPTGFRPVLEEARAYGLPILITENGIADADDNQRPRFLVDHLHELAMAIAAGIDVRGYYHWTLVDNFEWAAGFCAKFGLAGFDPTTRTRTARPSADVYRRIIEANGIPADLATLPAYPEPGLSCPRF
jgi:beta-glucosidase